MSELDIDMVIAMNNCDADRALRAKIRAEAIRECIAVVEAQPEEMLGGSWWILEQPTLEALQALLPQAEKGEKL